MFDIRPIDGSCISQNAICFSSSMNLFIYPAGTLCLRSLSWTTLGTPYPCSVSVSAWGRNLVEGLFSCFQMGAGEHNAPSWKLACYSENCLLSSNLNPTCMFSLPGFEEHTLFPSKCEKFNFKIKYVTIARKQKWKALLFQCQLPYIILLVV